MWLYQYLRFISEAVNRRYSSKQACTLHRVRVSPPILATDRYWPTRRLSALTTVPTNVPSSACVYRIPDLYGERFPTQVLNSTQVLGSHLQVLLSHLSWNFFPHMYFTAPWAFH
jgi:hypothetical protein